MKRILVVDDDAAVRRTLEMHLLRQGYAVDTAADGAAGLEKGSKVPGREMVGKITRAQVEKIAQVKMPDLYAVDLEGACKTVAGTARSMGIEVVD